MSPRTKRTRSESTTSKDHPPKTKRRTKASSEELHTIEDLVRTRATNPSTRNQISVLYPSEGTDYVGYTAAQLYELSNRAATFYDAVVPQRRTSSEETRTVALLGPSNFDYLVTVLALSKLGHTILLLSTRISLEAHISLLKKCNVTHLFVDEVFHNISPKIQEGVPDLEHVDTIASGQKYGQCVELDVSQNTENLDPSMESKKIAWIIHSSGSTSLPKPIHQTHYAALGNSRTQFNLVGFVTLPLYHMMGLGCVFRSIMVGYPIYMYNAALPLTIGHVNATLKKYPDIQILYGVPYVMKLIADNEEAIEACRKLEVLFSGGASTPKPIGDKLTRAGVNLVCHLGASETGQLMNSFRKREEILEWDYLRPSESVIPYLRWEPYDPGNGIFELVVLEGWPSKQAKNREDGAYATSDLWERHPTKNAWRYYARKDDTIVLVNGEKANPLLFEGLIRESPWIAEAVVFGAGKSQLGVFVITTDASSDRDQIMKEIWPTVEKANMVMPGHAQLSKDMIRIFPHGLVGQIRKTDKSTIMRAAFYKEFASLIDGVYDKSDDVGTKVLQKPELLEFLNTCVMEILQPDRRSKLRDDLDLFSLGVDSLQASQLRSAVLKTVDIGSATLGENFVFDFPTINAMANELLRLRSNCEQMLGPTIENRMRTMLDRYSQKFPQHEVSGEKASGRYIVVTGATGSLGAHLVAQLAAEKDVEKIVCLVRASSDEHASSRVTESLQSRRLDSQISKLISYAADLEVPGLGLPVEVFQNIISGLTAVFHCSWTVNFNLGLESFEDCIKGTRNLIDMALQSQHPQPAMFAFCSSISTVGGSGNTVITEDFPGSLNTAQSTGYARSKLIAEELCFAASKATGIASKVLRIGQIIGDTRCGIWNPNEAVPMIIRSAKTTGALPRLEEHCSWLPVDTVARGLIELTLGTGHQTAEVFNVVNYQKFSWSQTLLPMLQEAGLKFEEVTAGEWLQRLNHNPDPISNPPYKLIDFFTKKYGSQSDLGDITFVSEKACAGSSALAAAPAIEQGLVNKIVDYLPQF